MKIKNNSNFPKIVSSTRLEPGETKEITGFDEENLPLHVEVIEKSGDSDSDQNTKDEKSESEKEENGGEEKRYMPPNVYHGRQGTVQVGETLSTIDETNDLETQFTSATDYTGDVMDISINDPEASIDLENTFGGQFKVETPSDLVEIEVTMKFNDQEVFEEIHGSSSDVDGTWSRISGTREPGSRKQRSFYFELDDDGDIVRYFCNNAIFQSFGEVSMDAEGFAEITAVVVCLVEDREIEQNF